ncbi:MAG: hypothetical protein ACTHNU_15455 [Gaiellales bacterium]
MKQELTATLGTLTGIQNSAPAQIKPDIGVFVDYITQLQSVLAKHNYSVLASVPELQTLQAKEAKLHTATAHIDAWGKANGCSS